jgi:GH43 family beta-xylosidase
MKLNEINIRDPFILTENDKYYMYGSRGWELWELCTGLDAYVSSDLETWEGPIEVFTKPENFWADRNFWAPEVHKYKDSYYMFVSFKSGTRCRGTQILRSDSPLGPFLLHSDGPVTPVEWECLDGTFYVDKEGRPYIVFCHEWVQAGDGTVCSLALTEDLTAPIGEPRVLFHASEAVWTDPVTWGKLRGYVTDGPFMHRLSDGRLMILWASFHKGLYCQAMAFSDSGEITGNWSHAKAPLYSADGGHGMVFRALDGRLKLTLHSPNDTLKERPMFFDVEETNNVLQVIEKE